MYKSIGKRIFDSLLAFMLLVLVSPIFIAIVVLLTITNSGRPIFLQKRPGKSGKIFTIAKLKTMNDRRDANGELLPDGERLTVIGSFIRKLSLDELPQLFNVLKGDMSFVGPRPLLVEYLPLYSQEQRRRHCVTPGITGWAQVNGRNAISWEKKFEYDVWYVDHLSFSLDLKILFLTLIKVFKTTDINSATSATMEKFTGNQK